MDVREWVRGIGVDHGKRQGQMTGGECFICLTSEKLLLPGQYLVL